MKGKLRGVLTGVLLALICAGAASAAEYGVPGGSIRVNGSGVVTSATTTVTEVEIPAEVNGIAVTAIGPNAFKTHRQLTRVVIPDSVEIIDTDAFNGCSALADVTLPAGAVQESGAFSWCTAVSNVLLTGTGPMADFTDRYTWTPWYSGSYYNDHDVTVEIAAGVTTISPHAFQGAGRVTQAIVAKTVTNIGESAFEGCSALGDLYFVEYADEIGVKAFKGCSGATGAVTVKKGVEYIPVEAFKGCTSLQTLALPASMKLIETDAFNGCSALETVTLPAGAVQESGAFSWCTAVKEVHINGSGEMADFTDRYTWTPWYSGSYYNDHDVTVEIAAGVTSIGPHAFQGAGRIVKATVADSVKNIGVSAFEGCSALGDLDFVKYAGDIGEKAFKGCSGATGAVTVKDGVEYIPAEAFKGCSSLQTLTLPASMKTIETDAFNACSALETVTVPAGAYQQSGAFAWCTAVKEVHINGAGEMADFTEGYTWTPWYSGSYYNDHDVTVDVASGVTSIGPHAFHGAGRIIDAELPESVTTIRESAFESCSALGDLDFVQYADHIGEKAFKGCSGAKGAVVVKDGVQSLPLEAFKGCSSLQTLTLPESLRLVETDAFNGCSALESVTLPGNLDMQSGAFSWCTGVNHVRVVGEGDMSDYYESYTWTPCYAGSYYNDHDVTLEIASGVTSIGAHAFHGCGRIVKATVADSVSKIGVSAFEGCSNLGDLEFVQYADEIGERAFKGCGGATGAVTVKDGVTLIPDEAFKGCSSMETLALPTSLTDVGTDAFNGCSGLKDVTLPGNLAMQSGAFSWCTKVEHVLFVGTDDISDFYESYTWTPWYAGSYYNDHDVTIDIASGVTGIGAHTFHGCGGITRATVADTVSKIGVSAFEGCSSLESLYFVRYANEIGERAFKGCSGATGAVTVKDGVTLIPTEAFKSCSSLQTLTLPASVEIIDTDAFNGCSGLEDVTVPATALQESGAFSWCTKVKYARLIGSGDMRSFTDRYTWTPWYAGCYYNDHDVTVDIAQGVTSIGDNAFRGCGRMQSITIPVSVTYIGTNALYDCSALDVYYAGSETQWGGVTKTLSKKNPNTLGNTVLTMRYASAATLVVNAPDGKNVLSRLFAPPADTLVYVVGYDTTGKMTEFQSKTGAETLIFALSDTRTANVRVLFFAANFAPFLEPIPAAV